MLRYSVVFNISTVVSCARHTQVLITKHRCINKQEVNRSNASGVRVCAAHLSESDAPRPHHSIINNITIGLPYNINWLSHGQMQENRGGAESHFVNQCRLGRAAG